MAHLYGTGSELSLRFGAGIWSGCGEAGGIRC